MNNEALLSICAQLAKQGKQPSVGLVKARSKSKFHLAEIVAAVQYWKNNPDWEASAIEDSNKVENEIEVTDNESELIIKLEQRVTTLEATVATLESMLAQLLNKNRL